jgi:hypothetical protein
VRIGFNWMTEYTVRSLRFTPASFIIIYAIIVFPSSTSLNEITDLFWCLLFFYYPNKANKCNSGEYTYKESSVLNMPPTGKWDSPRLHPISKRKLLLMVKGDTHLSLQKTRPNCVNPRSNNELPPNFEYDWNMRVATTSKRNTSLANYRLRGREWGYL